MTVDRVYRLLGGNLPLGLGQTQQVRCLFKENHSHRDSKKSARIYEDSDKYFCYACMEHPLQAWELYSRVKDLPKDKAVIELKAVGIDLGVSVHKFSQEEKKERNNSLGYFSDLLRQDFSRAIAEIRRFYKIA